MNHDAVARAKMTDKSARIRKNDDAVTHARERNDAVTHENAREKTPARVKPHPGAQLATKRKTATESPYAGTDRREYK